MDAYLIVDPDSRNITIPEIESAFGVYGDNNAERKYFKSPRIVGNGIDLTECYLYVNYISASTKIGQILCDVGDAPNGTATEDEIVFSWPITRNVLDKNISGEIFFAVQAKTKTGDTVFTTRKAKGNCYESIEGTETVAEEYADIILQLISRMDKVEENIGLEVDNYFKENPVVTSEYLTQTLQPVKDDVSSIKEDLGNYIFYNIGYEISKSGAWLDNTGNEVEAGGWSVSNYIKISVGNTYSINGISTPTIKRKYALYDENRIFTRFIENNKNEGSLNVVPAYNECYIRLSIRYDDTLKILTTQNLSKNDYRINDKLNVKYFGAVGDGKADDTGAIQHALNLAQKTGVSVYLPSGKYLITNLKIPANVALLGENGKTSPEGLGSVLYCTDRNNPAVILNSCSSIKNIAFFYTKQGIVNDYPVTYPETIKLSDTSTTTLVEIDNINLINSYYAINATPRHEKLRVNNVWGYAINKGLFIDGSTDVDIINNVHFNYNTLRGFYDESVNEKFESFTSRVGVAFQFGRCDTAIIQNIFAYGYRIGMQLVVSVTSAKKLPPTYTIFTNISMDTCNYPLWIGNASHVLFNNFVGISNNHTGDYSDVKTCVFIGGGDGVCMSNSILTGFGNMIKSSGTDISLSNCDIRNYNREGESETAFAIETINGDIAINNSLIIGSTNRKTGFIHGYSGANSITATGCIMKNIMQGKLIQVDNVDTIITQGLNTLINSAGVIN